MKLKYRIFRNRDDLVRAEADGETVVWDRVIDMKTSEINEIYDFLVSLYIDDTDARYRNEFHVLCIDQESDNAGDVRKGNVLLGQENWPVFRRIMRGLEKDRPGELEEFRDLCRKDGFDILADYQKD